MLFIFISLGSCKILKIENPNEVVCIIEAVIVASSGIFKNYFELYEI